jgi:hypothetical protein
MGKILYRWGFPVAMLDSRRNNYIWNYLDIFTYLNPSPNVKMWARWSRCRISLFIGCNDFQIVLFTGFVWTQELIIISTCKYWIDCRVCPNIGYQGTPNSPSCIQSPFPLPKWPFGSPGWYSMHHFQPLNCTFALFTEIPRNPLRSPLPLHIFQLFAVTLPSFSGTQWSKKQQTTPSATIRFSHNSTIAGMTIPLSKSLHKIFMIPSGND